MKEALNLRTWIQKPISTWLSRQLVIMSARELQDNQGILKLVTQTYGIYLFSTFSVYLYNFISNTQKSTGHFK